MTNRQLNLEQMAQKLSKEQIIAKLKQLTLKGGDMIVCPPPFEID